MRNGASNTPAIHIAQTYLKRYRRGASVTAHHLNPGHKTPGFLAGNEQWARDFRAKGFRMIAYGVDTLLMQGALAHGIKLLQETVKN